MEDEDVPNWREVLKAQQDDLKFLSQNAVDDDLDADIDKVLSRPVAPSSWIMKPKVSSTMNDLYEDNDGATDNKRQLSSLPAADVLRGTSSPPRPGSGVKTGEAPKENLSHIEPSHDTDPLNAGESVATPKAPDAGARFQKAKIKMLTKQLEDAQSSRKLVTDQMENLKQQLKNDREENKQLKKRIQILEIENKRASSRKQNETTVGDKAESLLQEVNQLKKDLQSSERIAKQADTDAKNKDAQLKRALEVISKLKAQVAELQQTDGDKNNENDSNEQLVAANNRIKTLEKQRNDLISAFRKQMKLIDLLKRQKMHIEASRLLSFTEDEFMKTLDWAL